MADETMDLRNQRLEKQRHKILNRTQQTGMLQRNPLIPVASPRRDSFDLLNTATSVDEERRASNTHTASYNGLTSLSRPAVANSNNNAAQVYEISNPEALSEVQVLYVASNPQVSRDYSRGGRLGSNSSTSSGGDNSRRRENGRNHDNHRNKDSESEEDENKFHGPRRVAGPSRRKTRRDSGSNNSEEDWKDGQGPSNKTQNDEADNKSHSTSSEDEAAVNPSGGKGSKSRPSITEGTDENQYGPLTDSRLVPDPSNYLQEFAMQVAPEGVSIKCRITRDKGRYSTFYLYMERDDGKRVCLLTARRRKRSKTSNYLISCEPNQLSRASEYCVGKVRSNFVGTRFVVYDHGYNPAKPANKRKSPDLRREMAAIVYDTNIMGFKGPRHMTVLIPGLNSDHERIDIQPKSDSESILERLRKRQLENITTLVNKPPEWNTETRSFVLNFNGRVTRASVKNFQLIHESDKDYIALQFGRVKSNIFTMDYSYPFCALQAFGIVLSSFDKKLVCE